MNLDILSLTTIALLTGIVHTFLGPDHYLPFIALAKVQSWSRKKTTWITFICGLGHIFSSVVLGYLAFGLRFSLNSLHIIDSTRSDLAAWALIAFGFAYFIWGLKGAFRENRKGRDFSVATPANPALWILFIIFVVGPCEPLFVLMSYPALAGNLVSTLLLIGIFGAATVATMLTIVLTASYGLHLIRHQTSIRFAPAIAGLIIMSCGLGIKYLGL